jgi:hypothetical protein
MSFKALQTPSWSAGLLWWMNCVAAGYVIGEWTGSAWLGLVFGAIVGLLASLTAAGIGEKGGCLPFSLVALFGLIFLGSHRIEIAWGVCGVSALFALLSGIQATRALRWRRAQRAFERAIACHDTEYLVSHWQEGGSACERALPIVIGDPNSAELLLKLRAQSQDHGRRYTFLILLAELGRPELRPFFLQVLKEEPENHHPVLTGLMKIGEAQDVPRILRSVPSMDDISVRAAIDLAARHQIRESLESLDLAGRPTLQAYRDTALGRIPE